MFRYLTLHLICEILTEYRNLRMLQHTHIHNFTIATALLSKTWIFNCLICRVSRREHSTVKEIGEKDSSPEWRKVTTRRVSCLRGPYPLVGPRGMSFQQRDVCNHLREDPPAPPVLRAIRVHLGVKSISSSRQHANEGCCKRRPTSRMRDPHDRTDNTRESTMPVSSAFLVCQAHVKARLRESLVLSSRSHPLPAFLRRSFPTFLIFTLAHFPPASPSLVPSHVVDTTVTVTNDTDVPRGYNGFKSRSFHLIRGHSSPASTYELSPRAPTRARIPGFVSDDVNVIKM